VCVCVCVCLSRRIKALASRNGKLDTRAHPLARRREGELFVTFGTVGKFCSDFLVFLVKARVAACVRKIKRHVSCGSRCEG